MYCMHESRALSSFPYDFLSLLFFWGWEGVHKMIRQHEMVTDLGGFEGAITEAKYSWFCKFPLMTSATVLMV